MPCHAEQFLWYRQKTTTSDCWCQTSSLVGSRSGSCTDPNLKPEFYWDKQWHSRFCQLFFSSSGSWMNDLWVFEISFHEKSLGNSCPNCFHSIDVSGCCNKEPCGWRTFRRKQTWEAEFLHKKRDGWIFSFRRAVEFPVPCSSLHACNTKVYKNFIFLPTLLPPPPPIWAIFVSSKAKHRR